MRVRSVAVAAVLALLGGLGFAPDSTAHTGDAFCKSSFANVPSGSIRVSDQTQSGSGTGSCATAFQGFPLGVIGLYDALSTTTSDTDPEAPAEVHVEVWLRLTNGTQRKYAECEDGNPYVPGGEARYGTAECTFESNGETGEPLTAPEPLPTEIIEISCIGHTHARVKVGTAPVARVGCYSTNEAEAALRADMGLPPAPSAESEDAPDSPPAAVELPDGLPAIVASVVSNTYSPEEIVVTPGSDLRYHNLDLGVFHDVVALDATRSEDSAEWCDVERFPDGCPLFYSPLIKGAPGASTKVEGLADAEPGLYEFFCTIHLEMIGRLRVVDL